MNELRKSETIKKVIKRPVVADVLRWFGIGKLSGEALLKRRGYRSRVLANQMLLLNGPIPPKTDPETIRMLVLEESDGKYDWLEFANDDPHTELLTMSRGIYRPVFYLLLADYLAAPGRDVIGTVEEFFKPEYDEARERWRAYCVEVVEAIADTYEVDVFILPKIHDDWIIDLNIAIQKVGVPALITERENVATPMRMKKAPPTVKQYIDFSVDRLCLASKQHEEFWVKGGHDPDKIVVTGSLKSDFWLRKDLWKEAKEIHPALDNDRLKVLYFAFGKDTYRYPSWYPDETRDWTPLLWDVHHSLARLLTEYPEPVQLIYKSGGKPRRDLAGEPFRLISDLIPSLTEQNLLLLNQLYRAEHLIVNADLVIGFQSSAVIESMFVEVPIIHLGWGELYDDTKDTLLPLNDLEGIIHAESRDELDRLIDSFIADPEAFRPTDEMMSARKEFREFYYNRVDGKVGERVLNEARDLVRQHRAG